MSDFASADGHKWQYMVTTGNIMLSFRAHKLVLSSCSPLFRQMLKKNTHPSPIVFLHGIRFADLSAILNFMYHGEVNVGQASD